MQTGHRHPFQALRRTAAVVRQPVVVSTAYGVNRREVLMLVGTGIQHDAGEDYVNVTALKRHVPQTRLNAEVTYIDPHRRMRGFLTLAGVPKAQCSIPDRVL